MIRSLRARQPTTFRRRDEWIPDELQANSLTLDAPGSGRAGGMF